MKLKTNPMAKLRFDYMKTLFQRIFNHLLAAVTFVGLAIIIYKWNLLGWFSGPVGIFLVILLSPTLLFFITARTEDSRHYRQKKEELLANPDNQIAEQEFLRVSNKVSNGIVYLVILILILLSINYLIHTPTQK